MKTLKIVIAQINLVVGDIKKNAHHIIDATQKAVDQHQADIVLFPELALSSYPPEDLLFRPGFYSRCNAALADIIQSTKNTTIIIGHPTQENGLNYNKATVISDGKVIADYAKQKLPNYTVFDEKRYFTPGTSPCVFKIKGVKVGITICEDLWHDGPAQQSVKAGAQIILSLNASPYDRNKVRSRQTMLENCAQQVKVPIVYANLVGGQDELVFDGGSMIVNADGQRCQQGPYHEEALIPVDVNIDKPLSITPQALPERLTEEDNIYRTLVLGVRDYIEKNHFPGALLGLSGGIDSALTLALAVDAIGAERVHTIMMPSQFTADISKNDAKTQAELLNVEYDSIAINSLVEVFQKSLAQQFHGLAPNVAEENIQARIRGTLLMAVSNKKGYMVLATGNKSEMSVGYSTLYGDMCGGFAPLKDIPKTMVYRLCHYRNTLSYAIPDRVITRPPSAELAEDQKDEDSLPPYSILDEILDRYIDKDQDPRHIHSAGFDQETVNKVVKMVDSNEYKRRQAPIGIRTSQRAFGKDRRYPITSGYKRNIE